MSGKTGHTRNFTSLQLVCPAQINLLQLLPDKYRLKFPAVCRTKKARTFVHTSRLYTLRLLGRCDNGRELSQPAIPPSSLYRHASLPDA